jgi:hypothetical protein
MKNQVSQYQIRAIHVHCICYLNYFTAGNIVKLQYAEIWYEKSQIQLVLDSLLYMPLVPLQVRPFL